MPLRLGDCVAGVDPRSLHADRPMIKCGVVEEILPPDPDVPGEQCRAVIRDRTKVRKTISWPLYGR